MPGLLIGPLSDMNHEYFMKKAIQLSKEGMDQNCGGPFGAIIVKESIIIGTGQNQVTSTNDPTAHAEVVAIRTACKATNNFNLEGSILYTSCEPCPMCLAACYWARISTIYYANTREDAAKINFDDAHIYNELVLPIKKRAILMKQLLRDDAQKVFLSWSNKSDRIAY